MKQDISPFSSLKISNFRTYLSGRFISEIGNQMQIVAIAWQIYEMTRNPASLGLIGVANIIPILLFSLVGGLVADKLDRKKVMVLAQSSQLVLALILFAGTQYNFINPWLIYLILFLTAIAQSFSLPATQAILPHLVPKYNLMNALSLHTLQFQSAILLGPAIGGLLIGGFGVSSVYLFNSFSFLFFITTLLLIKIPLQQNNGKEVEFSVSSIKTGVKFVITTPILYTTMILDFLVTFFGTATILMPVFAKDVLHVGPKGLGLLYSAPAVGGVLAGILLSSFHHKIKHQGIVIIGSIFVYGLATIGFGLSKNFALALLFLVFVGFGDMVSTIIRNTIRQIITPDHLRGRMASVMRIFFQGGPQLGEIEAGFLAKIIGGPMTVFIGGIGVIAITGFIALKSKSLRQYQGKDISV